MAQFGKGKATSQCSLGSYTGIYGNPWSSFRLGDYYIYSESTQFRSTVEAHVLSYGMLQVERNHGDKQFHGAARVLIHLRQMHKISPFLSLCKDHAWEPYFQRLHDELYEYTPYGAPPRHRQTVRPGAQN